MKHARYRNTDKTWCGLDVGRVQLASSAGFAECQACKVAFNKAAMDHRRRWADAGGGMTLSCGKCGGVAGIDAWTRRPVSGDLPRGQFQCPSCGFAFRRQEVGQGRTVRAENGAVMQMPGRVALVPCASVL